ncbi:hypothetical protein NP233_g9091 [Leucocoprinus birnbaumii]|uniref:GP-PDE domain-containing protein n=1 Tax=Leucocoprinus birnbaumii TaxID=56174 RepID=A0AAD5VL70_9AGAR|nr:hypothetical protein NP233_g9091 [Leucocoprinus birnbaumii]
MLIRNINSGSTFFRSSSLLLPRLKPNPHLFAVVRSSRRMQSVVAPVTRALPDCWGHRGASSRFPENTLASFEAAIRDGAEGIESDVHVSADDVVVMFHDPGMIPFLGQGPVSLTRWCLAALGRTTTSRGNVLDCGHSLRIFRVPVDMELTVVAYRTNPGEDVVWRTGNATCSDHQIPTAGYSDIQRDSRIVDEGPIRATCPFASRSSHSQPQPENQHVKFNVDVKVQNDPDRLFKLMNDIITSQPDWETTLAPRILLGLWHPRFLTYAKQRLPYCRRSYIGNSIAIARKYFWNDCHAFSVAFAALTTADGQKFRQECKTAGKNIMVWTVNEPAHMMEAVRWGVSAIITDVTKTWLDLRAALQNDYDKMVSKYGRLFLWTPQFFLPVLLLQGRLDQLDLERVAGPFDQFLASKSIVELKV